MTDQQTALTIVICSDFAAITGGQAKVAIESAIGLKKQGHRVIFFAATAKPDPSLSEAGIEIHCLGQHDILSHPSALGAAVQGIRNTDAAAALEKLLAGLPRENTVIHVHGWAKALSPHIAGPIARSGLPAVYTLHEYFMFCPNGGFFNYQTSTVCTLKPLSLDCWRSHCDTRNYGHKLWRAARQAYAEHIAHLPDAFSDYITISAFEEKIVDPYIPAAARRHRVPNPVNVEDLGPKADPAGGDIIFVGRLSPEKGAFLFAEAARKIGLVPVFIGDGHIAGELAARYPEAQLLGWQPAAEVRKRMRAARAIVFPSLWYETAGLTVLEGKALGLPVIVADNCAARDEVEDGVTGLWFKSGDADDLARALREMGDDACVASMSRAAYESYWSSPYTLDRHVAGLLAVYRGMCGMQRQMQSAPSLVLEASV